MEIHGIADAQARERAIAAAVAALSAGELVALPTETVYGLGADATDGRAVAAIYAAKGRPRFNPLIAHLPDLESAERHGVFDATARALAEAFWPGPLTLVVPKRPEAERSTSSITRRSRSSTNRLTNGSPARAVTFQSMERISSPGA